MADKLATTFDAKAATPALMDPQAYHATLEKLVGQGKGYGKTKNVGGYLLRDIDLVTETSSGKDETKKTIKVEKFYIVMDVDQYPSEYLRGLVVKDIARNWGGKVVRERDLDQPDFKGPGIWTIKQGAFDQDYMPSDPANPKSSTFKPNPEAYRVTLTTDTPINVPVQWGTFVVEAGGSLAVREKDIPALAAALADIRAGKASVEEALYAKDEKGNTVSKFDVYGMEPGFLEKNYDPVGLKPETRATAAAFAPKATPGASARKPAQ